MAFYGNREDFSPCYSTSYSTCYNYDYAPEPVQASSEYSSPYESGEPQLIEYKSSAYYPDDSFVTPLELSYSGYNYSEPKILHYDPIEYHPCYNYYESSVNQSEILPKFLQYDPPPYDRVYFPSETKFTISYSNIEFNEPEFEAYDPTPYDGGYDPVTTYGKPLPPSDATCYPRTVPQPDLQENFSYSSIPSPYGKEDETRPETETETRSENGEKVTGNGKDVGPDVIPSDGLENGLSLACGHQNDDVLPIKPPNGSKPVESITRTHSENGDKVTGDGKDVGPSNGPENGHYPAYGHQNGPENGSGRGYGYESETRQVPQIPYGSGLEAMDLCESIFGYWPCLAKSKREQQKRNNCRFCEEERLTDPWESAANYLFGSPIVYDCENYHHHYQPQYGNDQCSWP